MWPCASECFRKEEVALGVTVNVRAFPWDEGSVAGALGLGQRGVSVGLSAW